jgi:PPM family protein phosphatase
LFLTDSVFAQPIIISDTILVRRDSLYIKSTGNVVLRRDSAYTGPAILLASNCKNIVMDNLQFENFNIGISVQNNALQLKNVRFNNCVIAVQTLFTFLPDQYISGRLSDSSLKKDSIPNE